MLAIIEKMFIILLSSIVNASKHKKYNSLNNQKCMIQSTLPYSQEFNLYTFEVKLDWCVRSCNTLDDSANRVFISNKTKDLNLSVLNMITGTNE